MKTFLFFICTFLVGFTNSYSQTPGSSITEKNANLYIQPISVSTNQTNNLESYTSTNINSSGEKLLSENERLLISEKRVMVYPNPSNTGKVSVVFNGTNINNDVILVDLLGQTIKQWNTVSNNRMEISNLRKGVYTLIVRDRQYNVQYTKRIIIE